MDVWFHIALHCEYQNTLKLQSVCIFFNNLLSDENFWKEKFYRDFQDIHKKDNEPWRQYYKRRTINYGQPIVINSYQDYYMTFIGSQPCGGTKLFKHTIPALPNDFDDDPSKNNIVQSIYGISRVLFLTNRSNLYYLSGWETKLLCHDTSIKKFYDISYTNGCFFIDVENKLHNLKFNHTTSLVDSNVVNMFIVVSRDYKIYYTKLDGTYCTSYITSVKLKLLDYQILGMVKYLDDIYFISMENDIRILWNSSKGSTYYDIGVKTKFKQITYHQNAKFKVLTLDGVIYIVGYDKTFMVEGIFNVEVIEEKFCVTKNGDMYYLSEEGIPELFDTDVVNICSDRCYIKRNLS